MKIERSSSITRSIDLAYPTNRAIAIITLLFFLGAAGFQLASGKNVLPAFYSGLKAGGSVFFAWAFARELDPDNELSAFVAAFLGCTGFLRFPPPSLLVLILELLLIRIVNRSTGLPAKNSDSLAILVLSGWISLQESWSFGLLAAMAFFLDGFLPGPDRKQRVFGVAALIISFLAFPGGRGEEIIFQAAGLFVFPAALLFMPRIFSSRKIKSKGDLTGTPLNPLRVQAAQLIALLSTGLLAALEGREGVESLMPLWGALLGISLYGDLQLLLKILRSFFPRPN